MPSESAKQPRPVVQTAWTPEETTKFLVLAVELGAVRAFDPETRERVTAAEFAREPGAFFLHGGDYKALIELMRRDGLLFPEPQGSA